LRKSSSRPSRNGLGSGTKARRKRRSSSHKWDRLRIDSHLLKITVSATVNLMTWSSKPKRKRKRLMQTASRADRIVVTFRLRVTSNSHQQLLPKRRRKEANSNKKKVHLDRTQDCKTTIPSMSKSPDKN
jgi:hypothetical protein